jgi:CubicO group peptidase (beta-lactamase class C family)
MYNAGALVLGVLCARAAEKPYDEVMQTRLFEPLGMADTGFVATHTGRLATAYVATEDGLQAWDSPDGQWCRPPAFPDGAAGLVSTVDDRHAYARMLLRGGDPFVSPDAVAAMTSNQVSPEQLASSEAFLQGRGWGFCQSVITDGERAGTFGCGTGASAPRGWSIPTGTWWSSSSPRNSGKKANHLESIRTCKPPPTPPSGEPHRRRRSPNVARKPLSRYRRALTHTGAFGR